VGHVQENWSRIREVGTGIPGGGRLHEEEGPGKTRKHTEKRRKLKKKTWQGSTCEGNLGGKEKRRGWVVNNGKKANGCGEGEETTKIWKKGRVEKRDAHPKPVETLRNVRPP